MSDILDLSGNVIKAKGLVLTTTPIADIAVTVTSGSEPTPNGAITIANSATPTVVELLEYCRELRAKVEALADAIS